MTPSVMFILIIGFSIIGLFLEAKFENNLELNYVFIIVFAWMGVLALQ